MGSESVVETERLRMRELTQDDVEFVLRLRGRGYATEAAKAMLEYSHPAGT